MVSSAAETPVSAATPATHRLRTARRRLRVIPIEVPLVIGSQGFQDGPDRVDAPGGGAGGGVERTLGVGGRPHVGAASRAVGDEFGEVLERGDDSVGIDVGQAEGANSRGVDDPSGGGWFVFRGM